MEETVGIQRLKPVYFANMLNNKLSPTTEMLYDSNCLKRRNSQYTVNHLACVIAKWCRFAH